MTVAHEVKYPWFKYKPWPKKYRYDEDSSFNWNHKLTEEQRAKSDRHWPRGYRETFITIWHVDPERGGSDDSCGYSYVRLNPNQRERLRNAAWHEGRNPVFLCCDGKEWDGTVTEALTLYIGMVLLVCRVLDIRLSYDEIQKYAAGALLISDINKPGDVFCFQPGYHTNSEKDSERDRQEHFTGILCGIARGLLTQRRPWWKHPKWHFWHFDLLQCAIEIKHTHVPATQRSFWKKIFPIDCHFTVETTR